jgi:hypothetical protein
MSDGIKEIEEMHVIKSERVWGLVKREFTAAIVFVGMCFLLSDLFGFGMGAFDAVVAVVAITAVNSLFIKKLDIHILKGYFDRDKIPLRGTKGE